MKLKKIITLAALSVFGYNADAQTVHKYKFDKQPEKLDNKISFVVDTTKYRCPCVIFEYKGNNEVVVRNLSNDKFEKLKEGINKAAVPLEAAQSSNDPYSMLGVMINDLNKAANKMKKDKQLKKDRGISYYLDNYLEDLPSQKRAQEFEGSLVGYYYTPD
jgi:hypothetical protein